MGLFNKIVDLFTDETEEEVTKEIEVEPKKEENKLPTFMRNKIEKEEEEKKMLVEEPKIEEKVTVSDREFSSPSNKFSFPINFDENDFVDNSRIKRKNILEEEKIKKEKEISVKKIYEKKEVEPPKRFKPTPIVSPVYGVLEKNYTKEEILEKNEEQYEIQRPSKKVDFESVRRKAFGNLSDEIRDNLCDNCEYLKEIKKVQKLTEENLLSDILKDDETIATAEENYYDFGVEYEQPKKTEINIDEVNVNINPDIKITDHNTEETKAEKIEVKDLPKEEKKMKDSYEDELELITENDIPKRTQEEDLELSDDIFNLIDSMYKEEEE